MSDLPLSCTPLSLYGQGTGVCFLLQIGSYRFLLDCGLHPETLSQSLQSVLINSDVEGWVPLHGLILSHAHTHQTQGLRSFVQHYPTVPVYSSVVTASLLQRLGTLDLGTSDLGISDLGTSDPHLPSLCPLNWRSSLQIRADLTLELFPAGHLPGAAMALITHTPASPSGKSLRPYTVLYTGDCTLAHNRFVEGLPLSELRGLRPDVLIVDGTAGTARYGRRRQHEITVLNGIERAFQAGRSVILPLPKWGLGQEILLSLKAHPPFTEQQRQFQITEAFAPYFDHYQHLLPHFPTAIQNLARQQSLFWEADRFPQVQCLREQTGDSIGSETGDQTGTRGNEFEPQPTLILVREDQDWTRFLPALRGWEVWFPRSTEGEVSPLKPWMEPNLQQWLPPTAIVPWSLIQARLRSGQGQIQTYFFPEHCDGIATTQLIHNIRPQHVLFIGPEIDRLAELAALDELNSRYKIHLPALGQTTEFLVGETFFQPTTPDLCYEIELQEDASGAWLPFPSQLTQDPRWYRLADTGILQLRWQGDELIVRGISGRELMNQDLSQRDRSSTPPLNLENCGTCRHYRGQRCWNVASPLQGFKVSPEGFCPHHQG
jgi:glyoxylase-like metal-dependent hydrolase (beta-lactamase superfamily II)